MAADKQAAPQAETAVPASDAKPKSRMKTLLIVGLLMILEGVGVLFAAKMLGGSGPAVADFDGDGRPEVIAVYFVQHSIEIWRYDASAQGGHAFVWRNVDINGTLNAAAVGAMTD